MLIDIMLAVVLLVCLATDISRQKIYNKVVLPGILAALLLNLYLYGFGGLKTSILGFLAGFAVLLIPYLLGGMGAGDVKLMAFIGTAKGALFVLNSAIYMALAGGAISLGILAINGQLGNFFKSVYNWLFWLLFRTKRKLEFAETGMKNKFPYGIAIAAGAFICMFFKGAWVI